MRRFFLFAIILCLSPLGAIAGEPSPKVLAFVDAQRKTAEAYARLSFKAVLTGVSQDETFGKPLTSTQSVSVSRRGVTYLFSSEASMAIQQSEVYEGGKVVAHDYRIVEEPRASRVLLTDELSVSWQDMSVPSAMFSYGPDQNKREGGREAMHFNRMGNYSPARFCLGLDAPLFEQIALHPEYTKWEVRDLDGGNVEIKRVIVDASSATMHTLVLIADGKHGTVTSATGTDVHGNSSTAVVEFGEFTHEGEILPVPKSCKVTHVDPSGVVATSTTVTYEDFRDESKEPGYTIPDLGLPEDAEIFAVAHPSGHGAFKWSGGELKPIAKLSGKSLRPASTKGPAVRVPVESDSAGASRSKPIKSGN